MFRKITYTGSALFAVADSNGDAYVQYIDGGEKDLLTADDAVKIDFGGYEIAGGITTGKDGIYVVGESDVRRVDGTTQPNTFVVRLGDGFTIDTKFGNHGGILTPYGANLDRPTDLTARPDGNVFFTQQEDALGVVRPVQNLPFGSAFVSQNAGAPVGLVAQKTNQIVALSANGQLNQYDATGHVNFNFYTSTGPGSGDPDAPPVGLAADKSDDVYTAGTRNGRFYVKRFNGHDAPHAPDSPTDLRVQSVGQGSVSLVFAGDVDSEAASNTQYQIFAANNIAGVGAKVTLPPRTESYTFTGLKPGTVYYFRVRAVNAYGTSASSNVVTAVPSAGADPAVLRVNAGGSSFTDSAGHTYAADTGFAGGMTLASAYDVQGTADDQLYLSRASATNSTSPRRCRAATISSSSTSPSRRPPPRRAPGCSTCSPRAQALSSFDIVAAAGGVQRAVVKTIDVVVKDGSLDLGFAAKVGNATVSGIELDPA